MGDEIKPFMSSDKFQVYAGKRWLDRIMQELGEAKVVVLMLSKQSVERPWVNFEAGAAWTRNMVIIPVCYGGQRKKDLPKPYSSLQAVDLEVKGEDEYLARSVAHHLKLEGPMGYLDTALGALGGPSHERKCEAVRQGYDRFRSRLLKLKSDPSKDVFV